MNSIVEPKIFLDDINDLLNQHIAAIFAQREEILRAFIAKYGWEPERTIQVLEHRPDGGWSWCVRRMTDEEMKIRATIFASHWWCTVHNREATHTDANGQHCCDAALDGILLPCNVVFMEPEQGTTNE